MAYWATIGIGFGTGLRTGFRNGLDVAVRDRQIGTVAEVVKGNRTGEPIRPTHLFRPYSVEVVGADKEIISPADKGRYQPVHKDCQVARLRIDIDNLAMVTGRNAVLCIPWDYFDIDGRDDPSSQLVATLPKKLELSPMAHHALGTAIPWKSIWVQTSTILLLRAGINNRAGSSDRTPNRQCG